MSEDDFKTIQRSIDIAEYARSLGYRERPGDGIPGITVLDHPEKRECIAVARLASGGVYARIPDYGPRDPDESEQKRRGRLRDCITRATEAGSVVEFARNIAAREGRSAPSPEEVRQLLTTWHRDHHGPAAHDGDGKVTAGPVRLNQARTDWREHVGPDHARVLGLPTRDRDRDRGR